jgi:hypothetical protein
MSTQTFIFVHNQQIILDYLRVDKFKQLDNLIYVFVGNGDISKIEGKYNVIICRNLPINIEEFPKLTSFTGWYAIWKNKLYNEDFINLFEYDINLSSNFNEVINDNLISETNIIGYIPFNPHQYDFLKHSPWSLELLKSINSNYGINTLEKVSELPNNTTCSMTSNHTFSKKSFEEYMEWMEPMIDDIKISDLSGHQVERSISVFYLLKNLKNVKIIPNILHHFQFDSHKTQGIGEDKLINNYEKLL